MLLFYSILITLVNAFYYYYYYYSRQITHFWSNFLSPTRSLRPYLSQYFCGVTDHNNKVPI